MNTQSSHSGDIYIFFFWYSIISSEFNWHLNSCLDAVAEMVSITLFDGFLGEVEISGEFLLAFVYFCKEHHITSHTIFCFCRCIVKVYYIREASEHAKKLSKIRISLWKIWSICQVKENLVLSSFCNLMWDFDLYLFKCRCLRLRNVHCVAEIGVSYTATIYKSHFFLVLFIDFAFV